MNVGGDSYLPMVDRALRMLLLRVLELMITALELRVVGTSHITRMMPAKAKRKKDKIACQHTYYLFNGGWGDGRDHCSVDWICNGASLLIAVVLLCLLCVMLLVVSGCRMIEVGTRIGEALANGNGVVVFRVGVPMHRRRLGIVG